MPDEPRIAEIQAELSKLLFGDAASIMPEGLTAEAPSPVGLPLDAGDAACTDA
jgi:hypothetical protein